MHSTVVAHVARRALLSGVAAFALAAPLTGPAALAAPASGDLETALVPVDELNDRIGTEMQVISSESGTNPVSSPTASPAKCAALYAPGLADSYDGSGYTDFVIQTARAADGDAAPNVVQVIAEFPSASAAQSFLNKQTEAWQACPKLAKFSVDNPDGTSTDYKSGGATVTGLELFAPIYPPDLRSNDGCERVLQVKNSYIVDVRVCMAADSPHSSGGKGRGLRSQIVRNLS